MKNLFKLSEHVYVYLDTPTHSRRSQLLLLFSHTRRVMSIFFQHLYIQLFDFHFISNLRFTLLIDKIEMNFHLVGMTVSFAVDSRFQLFSLSFRWKWVKCIKTFIMHSILWIYTVREKKNINCTPFSFFIFFIWVAPFFSFLIFCCNNK